MNAVRPEFALALLISVALHSALAFVGSWQAGDAIDRTQASALAVSILAVADSAASPAVPRRSRDTAPGKPPETSATTLEPQTRPPLPTPVNATQPVDAPATAQATVTRPSPAPPSDQPAADETTAATLVDEPQVAATATTNPTGGKHAAATPVSVLDRPDVFARPLYHLVTKPPYPSRSRDLGEEGVVVIAVYVSSDGGVLEAYVSESSGYPMLDGSALATVTEKWRFRPGTRGGEAVASWVRVPIKFSIQGT